jgi:hypothetical protein
MYTKARIADPNLKTAKIYSLANKYLATIQALVDTGADVDLMSREIVKSLNLEETPLLKKVKLGSVKEQHALTITHAVKIQLRLQGMIHEHEFLVTDLPGRPEVILGRPWLQTHRPDIMSMIDGIGCETSIFGQDKVQECFAMGGVLAAIAAEEQRRKDLWNHSVEIYEQKKALRATVCQILDNHDEDEGYGSDPERADVRRTAVEGDPGVRGLTGNKPGWEETIPERFRRFNPTVFADPPPGETANAPGFECKIRLKDGAALQPCKLYNMSAKELRTLKELLDHELATGIIRPSDAEASSPVFFVEDPGSKQLRLVVDYRKLNAAIKIDDYPLPLSRTILGWIAGKKFARMMDARSGFARIPLDEDSKKHTAFKTFYGQFEYNTMPMGLATAPAIYQRFMNHVLGPLLGVCAFAYVDDVIIVADSQEDLDMFTHQVLERFEKYGVRVKPHKCVWDKQEFVFLGYRVVLGKGLFMAHDKCKFIREIKPPRGLKDLRSMLGMTNFYRLFIPHYSDLIADLTHLTKKGQEWQWSEVEERAWEHVLKAIREDVFLQGFDETKPIEIGTDASDVALGGYLAQPDEEGKMRPLYFFHYKFKDGETKWTTAEKELYAIVYAFEEYPDILSQPAHEIQIYSDHRNLALFMFSTDLIGPHKGRLAHWYEKLVHQRFKIMYLEGEKNVVPDFLSRYGLEDSAALDSHILLPLHRFHNKAQIDIASWFRKHGELNIKDKLEKSFASRPKAQQPSPIEEQAELDFLKSLDDGYFSEGEKLNDSPVPVPAPHRRGKPDVDPVSARMAAEQRKRFAARYKGAPVIEPRLTLDGHGAQDVVRYGNKGSLGWNKGWIQFESAGYQE